MAKTYKPKKDEAAEKAEDRCPNCNYCKHCGQSTHVRYIPYLNTSVVSTSPYTYTWNATQTGGDTPLVTS